MADRILVVDDEAMVAEAVSVVLSGHGFEVEYSLSADAAVEMLARGEAFSLVLMDIWFGYGETDGGAAAREIASRFDVPVVFYTGYDDEPVLRRVDGVAAYGVVRKSPQSYGILVRTVRAAIDRHRDLVQLSRNVAHAEFTVRETHHRVKNSFAVMASIVRLRTAELPNECKNLGDLLTAQLASFQRLHEQLQEASRSSHMPLKTFLSELLSNIFPEQPDFHIAVSIDGEDPVVSSKVAAPVGLIASEIALNSMKHSFAPDRRNAFHAQVKKTPVDGEQSGGELTVVLSDNGPPVSADVLTGGGSTGMRLVRALVHQLDAELHVSGHPSPTFALTIPLRE
jgi:two-component sensor histidine kinase